MSDNNDLEISGLLSNFAKFMSDFGKKYSLAHEITFPLTIKNVRCKPILKDNKNVGNYILIRPCGEKYKNKTYLGLYLGELPIENGYILNKETEELEISPNRNPAIYVPDLKEIIYGCESWWSEINSKEDLKEITDYDIENVWYVKALKYLSEKNENE